MTFADLSGSDYSALCLPFPSSCFRLSGASSVLAFRFRFLRFPRSLRLDFSCLPSRFRYSAFCLFPFVLPRFAPTAVPRVLALCFRFRPFPFPIRYMTFADLSGSDYSAFCSSFPFLPVSASQGLPQCSLSAFASCVSPFFPARFPLHFFPVSVLSSLFVSFHPSLIRFPQPFLRCLPFFRFLASPSCSVFSASLPFPFGLFRSASGYSASVSSVPFFPFLPHSGLSGAPSPLSLPRFSPFFPA